MRRHEDGKETESLGRPGTQDNCRQRLALAKRTPALGRECSLSCDRDRPT